MSKRLLVAMVGLAQSERGNLPRRIFNSNSFGVITSQANSPRQMQLGLKVYW